MNISLHGQNALVCGGSKGIGAAIAKNLLQAGANVVVLSRTKPEFECRHLQSDTANWQSTVQVVQEEQSKTNFDILVLNTGGPASGILVQAKAEDFIIAMQQHLVLNAELSKIVLPAMQQKKFGRILTITSTSVRIPIANLGVSNSVRAAVASWVKSLSNEVAACGVTVNNIMPGYIQTDRLQKLAEAQSQRQNIDVNSVEKQWLASIPMQRLGQTTDIAAAALFLLSHHASYITGVSLPVDGGRLGCI